jgi:hypothetical protein
VANACNRGQGGSYFIFRLTPRGLHRLRLEATDSSSMERFEGW